LPKDVDVTYFDENSRPSEIRSYHFENEENKAGWYYYDNEPYLTKTALKKELHLADEQIKQVINLEGCIKYRTETNAYRSSVVYCLEDVKSFLQSK
jgi:hypothetical protein